MSDIDAVAAALRAAICSPDFAFAEEDFVIEAKGPDHMTLRPETVGVLDHFVLHAKGLADQLGLTAIAHTSTDTMPDHRVDIIVPKGWTAPE